MQYAAANYMPYEDLVQESNSIGATPTHIMASGGTQTLGEYDEHLHERHDHRHEAHSSEMATKYPTVTDGSTGIEGFQSVPSQLDTCFLIGIGMLLGGIYVYVKHVQYRYYAIGAIACALYLLSKDRVHSLALGDANGLVWGNKAASKYYGVMESRLGKPTSVSQKSGGMARWSMPKSKLFKVHMIEDLSDTAVGFLESTVQYAVADDRLEDVHGLSEKVTYDAEQGLLSARGMSIEENVVTLAMATQIAQRNLSLRYIQSNDLYKKWLENGTKDNNALQKLLTFNVTNQPDGTIEETTSSSLLG